MSLTTANRACRCLEQNQHCPPWEGCGGCTAQPQNGSCEALKHAVNTVFSIPGSPTRASQWVSWCLSFDLQKISKYQTQQGFWNECISGAGSRWTGWLVMPDAYRLRLWGLEIISSSHPWVCTTETQGHHCSKAPSPQRGLTLWWHWIWGDGWMLSKSSPPEHSPTRRISAAIFRAEKCRLIGAAPSLLFYAAAMLYKNECLKLPVSKEQTTLWRWSLIISVFLFSCDMPSLLSS